MRIKILGNGGFISSGIPYNSFLIDNTFLVEAPPDVMVSLRNHGIRFYDLRRIYLSHFHGDHFFGMPFIILNLMKQYRETCSPPHPIEIIGPHGLREALRELQQLAIAPGHPSVDCIDELFRFVEIDSTSRVKLDGTKHLIFHEMAHPTPTCGFSVVEDGGYLFTYLADTVWSDSFIPVLANKPRIVFCDLNGAPDDAIKQHMSERDIVEKAIPVTGTSTRYIGVHLSEVGERDLDFLHYSRVGEEYEIG
ncbi:MAG: hypothetical protein JW913_13505 [Chitinispirillaceae bacterium]|nr:hypothetical protein [Chitinispirillaceae bacterium]